MKEYCTQNKGACLSCSLSSYGKNCMGQSITSRIELLKDRLRDLRCKVTGGDAVARSGYMQALRNILDDVSELGYSDSGLRLDDIEAFCDKHQGARS